MFEYHHTGLGLRGNEWDAFRQTARQGRSELESGSPERFAEANRYFEVLGMGRHYSLLRLDWPIIQNKLALETLAITSLRDASTFFRTTLSWQIRPNLEVYLVDNAFVGRPATEVGHMQVSNLSNIGIRYQFSFDKVFKRRNPSQ
jgi:hypothetical protein